MFIKTDIKSIKENAVDLISSQWGLVTAGDKDKLNTMTVSWGALGELWGNDTVTVYIRPQRYTAEFLDSKDYFTLSFYPGELKTKIHSVCGSKSGRDIDKVSECGLTPVFDSAAPYFEEAKLVIVCKKVAKGSFTPEQIIDKSIIDAQYPSGDFHYIYYGKIEEVLIKA